VLGDRANRSCRGRSRQKRPELWLPVAFTVFPGEIYQAPRSWAEKIYFNLICFNEASKGGHFAAWEEPQLFGEELRAAFRSLRGPHPGLPVTRLVHHLATQPETRHVLPGRWALMISCAPATAPPQIPLRRTRSHLKR
jgi:hypothetical protein